MNDEIITQVKAWVADATKGPQLHALLHGEVTRIVGRTRAEEFGAGTPYSDAELARRVQAFEDLTADLARSVAYAGYWGHPSMRPLWPGLVSRIANAIDRSGGVEVWLRLVLYPALLVLYSAGVASVAARRYDTLAALLTEAVIYDRDDCQPAALTLHPEEVIGDDVARRLSGLERHRTPQSDHLLSVVRPWLDDLVVGADIDRQFDRFEFLLGLVCYDMRRVTGHDWAPVGRFSWRRMRHGADAEIIAEIEASGPRWPLLREGLFSGSFDRLVESARGFAAHIDAIRRKRF